ncbi:MAG TPA: universal stress protein [Terriglobales bacterium]|nr:universal stress protein [Terriglobales bacterium]
MIFLPKRLLCLVDLSQVSPSVLSWARLFASSYRTQIEVFHALWAPKMADGADISLDVLGTEVEGQVNSLCDDAFGTQLKYVSTVVQGHPVKTILQHVEERPPDLIVLGSHGYDGYGEVLLGSVAENVVRTAPCPVVVVKGSPLPANASSIPKIVCAVDLGDFSQRCLLAAADIALMLDADLHVVFVAPSYAPIREAHSALEAWIPDSVWSSGKVHDIVLQGDPGEMLVGYARENQADLVIIAAEHRAFLEYTTLGRTTERVVRFSPSSVLVIPKITSKPEAVVIEPANA